MSLNRRQLLAGGAALGGGAAAGGWWARRRWNASARRALRVTRVEGLPAPAPGASLDFLVTGDTGAATDVRRAVVAAMRRALERIPASFVVLTGDNIYPAGVKSPLDPAWKIHFEDAFAPLLEAGLPFYPCLGNHDHMGDPRAQVEYAQREPRWRLPAPYHAFRAPVASSTEAEFFVLDTTPLRTGLNPLSTPAQVRWLDDALRASPAAWKVAIGHHPLHSGGPKGGSGKLRWHLGPAFAEHELDLYLSGHNHDLELLDPGRGWLQIVSGAGALPQDVQALDETLFSAAGGGFAWVSLRCEAAWIQFESADKPLASFRVERALG